MHNKITPAQSALLFKALLANAVFSSLSGVLMLILSAPIATLVGLPQPLWVSATGSVLIGFGAILFLHVRRRRIRRVEAIAISALDLAWVLASLGVVAFLPETFSPTGIITIVAVALIVLGFFEAQAVALWRTRGSRLTH